MHNEMKGWRSIRSVFITSQGVIQRIYIGGMSAAQIDDFIGQIIQ